MIMRTATKTPQRVRVDRIDGLAPKETRRFGRGRTCEAAVCSTPLSSYNPAAFCWVHEEPHRFIARAEREGSGEEPRVVELGELRRLLDIA